MKIILTGATGLIGSAVLQRLISLPTITSIIVLSRRELPTKHPKIQTIIIHDFLHGYSPDVLASIQGAEACIWVLGSPTSGREVHHDMTMAATKAFSENCVERVGKDSGGSGGGQKAFRFVYTSGSLVVRDQNAQTWFMGDGRKMRVCVSFFFSFFFFVFFCCSNTCKCVWAKLKSTDDQICRERLRPKSSKWRSSIVGRGSLILCVLH